MKRVLVDTSVWVDHFRHHNAALADLLELDLVMIHPMVLGELACGTPPSRAQTLRDLDRLQQTQQASVREVLAFIEREQLYGLGCGPVDLTLLASTLITPGVELWTSDKRLGGLAERFGVMHRPALH
ncbi:type II toxin-antitoxin system VapC family toxin [Aquabacterium sp. A7-Y]|uniref:type II toxin-antitoxin system VapC family toxin n=1 Tax=Aquabacterium sp. A7-Y TaxID=1349605 RepID=UPI00223E6756|nr:type II toxin-antitoxin system VapC family toxin [Aquabacterium sp. A7-Y]MCW7541532.1 type II toxin-antitoxin system VapC family toxin [Aquabacterium sp. A7-Y]